MPAGGMSTDVKPVRVATKTRGVFVNPGDAATNLIGHHAQITARRLDCNEVERHEMRAGIDKHFRRISVVLGFATQPRTAVDEHEYWCSKYPPAKPGALILRAARSGYWGR